jgi:hypothetical protein
MAKHDVHMRQTSQIVGNTDVSFEIFSDGEKIGELRISKGTIDWWPRSTKTRHARLSWERFASLMDDYAT